MSRYIKIKSPKHLKDIKEVDYLLFFPVKGEEKQKDEIIGLPEKNRELYRIIEMQPDVPRIRIKIADPPETNPISIIKDHNVLLNGYWWKQIEE